LISFQVAAAMRCPSLLTGLLLTQLLPSGPAQSQALPDRQSGAFRVINATDMDGMQFYLARTGEAWGGSRISRPMEPGAALNLRANPTTGCKVDVRLVLADGREVVARGHDICAQPTVTLDSPVPAASGARAPGLVRIVNRTGRDAMQFYLANAGAPLGPNRLGRPLPAGESLLQRAGGSADCHVDLRMVLADGQEEVRRNHDICARPTIVLGNAAPRPEQTAVRPPEPPQPGRGRRLSSGTGFLVADSRVMTSQHVVTGCSRLLVRAPDGRVHPAAPNWASDPRLDLAVLHVPGLQGPALAFRHGPVRRGEDVIVFGYPLPGLLSSDPKLTRGEISGLKGPGDDPTMFQVSAPVQPGNSGGPLLDLHGRCSAS
jgi:serine protease Do